MLVLDDALGRSRYGWALLALVDLERRHTSPANLPRRAAELDMKCLCRCARIEDS